MRPLTPLQQRFVEQYLIDLNATAAARRAGYKDGNKGRQLVTLSNVAAAIESARQKASKRTDIKLDRWLQELAAIAFSDPRKLYAADGSLRPIKDLEDEVAAAVAQVEVYEEFEGKGKSRTLAGLTKKIKVWDKLSALDKLGKHLGWLKDEPPADPSPVTLVVQVKVTNADHQSGDQVTSETAGVLGKPSSL